MSKGDTYRKVNYRQYADNYNRIFRKEEYYVVAPSATYGNAFVSKGETPLVSAKQYGPFSEEKAALFLEEKGWLRQ